MNPFYDSYYNFSEKNLSGYIIIDLEKNELSDFNLICDDDFIPQSKAFFDSGANAIKFVSGNQDKGELYVFNLNLE